MNQEITAILDKIARLKTLAERPGTPEEAAAAVAAIQRLMLRYNLSEAQVSTANRNEKHGFDSVRFDLGSTMSWRSHLMNAICNYTFCKAVFDHKGSKVNIIGEQHNIAIVTGLYDFLVGEVMRLADVGWNALTAEDRWGSTVRSWKNAFRLGAGQTLGARLRDQFKEQAKAEDETAVNALVVVKNDALARAAREFFPNSRASNTRASMSDQRGYVAGQIAGKGINLARQIEA